MPKNWKPDTWETLCHALAKDKDLKVWIYTERTKFFQHRSILEYLNEIRCGNAKASLEDPRTKE